MIDQATALRKLTRVPEFSLSKLRSDHCQALAVTSGKGGVGKTNFVVNLAISLQRLGKRVVILDADFGLANIDVFLGLVPTLHLGHVIEGLAVMEDIVLKGPEGISIIPASSGVQGLTEMGKTRRQLVLDQLTALMHNYDYLLIDTAAGISDNVIEFLVAAPQVVVVSAPEPTAIVDAYALIKVLSRRDSSKEVSVVINSVQAEEEAKNIFAQLSRVSDQFLGMRLRMLGHVLKDERVSRSVSVQQPLMIRYPQTGVARCFEAIASRLTRVDLPRVGLSHSIDERF